MTKRLKSKHKVDRRLKANLWGRPKTLSTLEHIRPDNMVKIKKESQIDYGTQLQAKQNLKHTMEI